MAKKSFADVRQAYTGLYLDMRELLEQESTQIGKPLPPIGGLAVVERTFQKFSCTRFDGGQGRRGKGVMHDVTARINRDLISCHKIPPVPRLNQT